MIAEDKYKELMSMTEEIRREELDSEEKWRAAENVRSRLLTLQMTVKQKITEFQDLDDALGEVIESL